MKTDLIPCLDIGYNYCLEYPGFWGRQINIQCLTGNLHIYWENFQVYSPSGKFIPGRRRDWRRKKQPTPVILPGKSHGQRSLAGPQPMGVAKSQAQLTECVCAPAHVRTYTDTHTHTHTHRERLFWGVWTKRISWIQAFGLPKAIRRAVPEAPTSSDSKGQIQ